MTRTLRTCELQPQRSLEEKGTVVQLAAYIAQPEPGIRGFSPQNIWRMRQFFEAYRYEPKLSTLSRELLWSSNLHILIVGVDMA
jgi:hypothetical protein